MEKYSEQKQLLPPLEIPKESKLNIKLSPQGDLNIDAENLTDNQSKELSDLILSVDANNVLRLRTVKQTAKEANDVISHILALIVLSFIALIGVYCVSKVYQPTNHKYVESVNTFQ